MATTTTTLAYPQHSRGHRSLMRFASEAEMQAYALGLEQGIIHETQPGSDPCRVRTESHPYMYAAWIQTGHYDNVGNVVWH